MRLEERTIGGLHDFLLTEIIPALGVRGARAVDLGAGSGALADRLAALGLDVVAVDLKRDGFGGRTQFIELDLDRPDFADRLGVGHFDLVTAVEVIEHLESPIAFLRSVRRLLAARGTAVLTTPNVENVPARMKFLLTGRIRMMDEAGDRTHVSPVFLDLLLRQYLPRTGLRLVAHHLYPRRGYKATRARYAWLCGMIATVVGGRALVGDNHVLVLSSAGEA